MKIHITKHLFDIFLKYFISYVLYISDAHTSSLMISDSDSDNEEEIIFDDDLNRQHHSTGMNNGGSSLSKRNGIITNHNQPRA